MVAAVARAPWRRQEIVRMTNPLPTVAGRSCAGCTLCCKLLSIAALGKPRAQWCRHCDPSKGCKIYDVRPDECRTFYCGYLTQEKIAEHWQPASSKMVLTYEHDSERIVIHVDPTRAFAWREEPYYSEIKEWAVRAAQSQGQVIVWQGRDAIAILPHTDKNIGAVRDDQFILTIERHGPSGITFDVEVVDAADPRVAHLKVGVVPQPVV